MLSLNPSRSAAHSDNKLEMILLAHSAAHDNHHREAAARAREKSRVERAPLTMQKKRGDEIYEYIYTLMAIIYVFKLRIKGSENEERTEFMKRLTRACTKLFLGPFLLKVIFWVFI
jgi:hypothetical protein